MSQDKICVNWWVNKWTAIGRTPLPSTTIQFQMLSKARFSCNNKVRKCFCFGETTETMLCHVLYVLYTLCHTNSWLVCYVCVVFFRHKYGRRAKALQTQSGLQAAALSRLQVRISASLTVFWKLLSAPWSSLCFILWHFQSPPTFFPFSFFWFLHMASWAFCLTCQWALGFSRKPVSLNQNSFAVICSVCLHRRFL